MAEKQEEKKVDLIEIAKTVDKTARDVRVLKDKEDRHSKNWKTLVKKLVSSRPGPSGKIGDLGFCRLGLALGLAIVTGVASFAFAGNKVMFNRPGPNGGQFQMIDDADGDALLYVIGEEGKTASLVLESDESDDANDTCTLKHDASDNFTITIGSTEALNLTSAGNLTIAGSLSPSGDFTVAASNDLIAISDNGSSTNTVISDGVIDGSTIGAGDIPSDRMTANAPVSSDFTSDGEVLVGTGSGTFAAESGSTLQTSVGIQGGQFTISGDGTYTQAYSVAEASAQYPVLTYAENPGDSTNTNVSLYITDDDGTNFVANGVASKKVNWFAR